MEKRFRRFRYISRLRKKEGDLDWTHGRVAAALTVVMLRVARMESKLSFMLTKMLGRGMFDEIILSLDVSKEYLYCYRVDEGE